MTITVDGCGYERAALSPGQRHAPPIAALWYQAWRLSAKGWSTTKAEGAIKKAVGGGDRSVAHCSFITFFCFSPVAAATEGSSEYRLPLKPLQLQHLINSVFPDNEDWGLIKKFLKQWLFAQNPFVLLAIARQYPAAPFLHLRLIFLIDPRTFLHAEDLPPESHYQELG